MAFTIGQLHAFWSDYHQDPIKDNVKWPCFGKIAIEQFQYNSNNIRYPFYGKDYVLYPSNVSKTYTHFHIYTHIYIYVYVEREDIYRLQGYTTINVQR